LPLLALAGKSDPQPPNVTRILENTRKLISDEAIVLARRAYLDRTDLPKMKSYLDLAGSQQKGINYLLLAIYQFMSTRDIQAAKQSIEEARKQDLKDFTWAYSKGFLVGYEGNLSDAYHTYKLAFGNKTGKATHIECELFLRKILEIEPDKIQLWYCLGLIYMSAHEDFVLAKQCFDDFIRKATQQGKYLDQIKYVERHLEKIRARGCQS